LPNSASIEGNSTTLPCSSCRSDLRIDAIARLFVCGVPASGRTQFAPTLEATPSDPVDFLTFHLSHFIFRKVLPFPLPPSQKTPFSVPSVLSVVNPSSIKSPAKA
jgi:hypothetical protein